MKKTNRKKILKKASVLLIAIAMFLSTVAIANTMDNEPPDPPIITAPEKVQRGKLFTVEAVTTDPEGDDVYYRDEFKGCAGPWFGPYSSGQVYKYMITITGSPGSYTLGIQSKDAHDAESEWSYVQINVTKIKTINTSFQWLKTWLHSYPNMFPILRQLLGL